MISKIYSKLLFSFVIVALGFLSASGQTDEANYVLKTRDGFLLVQNCKTVSYAVEFKGKKIEPMDGDHPKFVVDGKFVQVVTALGEDILKNKKDSDLTDEQFLETHKLWESDYLSEGLGAKISPTSELFSLISAKKAMFWSFPVPKEAHANVSHYLFLTTVIGKDILGLNAVTDTADQQGAFREYLTQSMNTLQTSDKPFDIKKLSESLAK